MSKLLESKKKQHYSRITDKGPSIDERVLKTIRNFLRKPVFENGNAVWVSELSSVMKKYKNTTHSSAKNTPVQTTLQKKGKNINFQSPRQKTDTKNKMEIKI